MGAGGQIHVLMLARQTFYRLGYFPSPHILFEPQENHELERQEGERVVFTISILQANETEEQACELQSTVTQDSVTAGSRDFCVLDQGSPAWPPHFSLYPSACTLSNKADGPG